MEKIVAVRGFEVLVSGRLLNSEALALLRGATAEQDWHLQVASLKWGLEELRRCSAGPMRLADAGLFLQILPSAPIESLTEPSNKLNSFSPNSLEMKRREKVGQARAAGQISWYSLAEKVQSPIPSTDSMIHIRGSLPRTGPISLAFEIVPGWQFPGRAQCWLGWDARVGTGWGRPQRATKITRLFCIG